MTRVRSSSSCPTLVTLSFVNNFSVIKIQPVNSGGRVWDYQREEVQDGVQQGVHHGERTAVQDRLHHGVHHTRGTEVQDSPGMVLLNPALNSHVHLLMHANYLNVKSLFRVSSMNLIFYLHNGSVVLASIILRFYEKGIRLKLKTCVTASLTFSCYCKLA